MFLLYILLFAGALCAFMVSSICGGGASFILIPALSALLPGAQVPASLSIGTATSTISRLFIFYKNIRWDVVIWFVPPAIPAVWLGAWLLTYVNPVYLELGMGLFLLSNLVFLFNKNSASVKKKDMPLGMLPAIGFAAGFVSGLTGAVGLLFNRFYFKYGLSKEGIVATRAANEISLHLIKLCLYAFFGLLNSKVLIFGGLIALAAVCSTFMVKYVLPLISENIFQRTGYFAMVISGVWMVINSSQHIVTQSNLYMSYQPEEKGLSTKINWHGRSFEIDLEYEDGAFEVEHEIDKQDLAEDKQAFVMNMSAGAKRIEIEEVYGFNKHYYELYVFKNHKILKYDF